MENLELLKAELIESLESYRTQSPELQLIIKLIKGTETSDPDFREALEDQMAEPIVNLFLDCYDSSDFLKWLANNDFDLFVNYRYSERIYLENYDDVAAMMADNESYFYGDSVDDFDGLMVNDNKTVFVYQW